MSLNCLPPLASRKLRTYLREAASSGVDLQPILGQRGFNPECPNDGAGLDWTDFSRTVSALGEALDPSFAVELGLRWDFTVFGLVGLSLLNSTNFGHFADRSYTHLGRAAHLDLRSRVSGQDWIIEIGVRSPMSARAERICVEEAYGAAVVMWQKLVGANPAFVRLEFARADAIRDKIVAERLGSAVLSGSNRNRLVLARSDRQYPIQIRKDDLRVLCEHSCDRIMSALAQGPWPLPKLREMLLLSLGKPPSLEAAARELNLSRRSLNRLLEKQGVTYRALCGLYRVEYGMALLQTRELCVKEIAHALGFSSPASFRRKFQAWTSEAVGAWSRARLGHPPPRH